MNWKIPWLPYIRANGWLLICEISYIPNMLCLYLKLEYTSTYHFKINKEKNMINRIQYNSGISKHQKISKLWKLIHFNIICYRKDWISSVMKQNDKMYSWHYNQIIVHLQMVYYILSLKTLFFEHNTTLSFLLNLQN